ncbi:MAG: SGNH/GDSL hydrolase family protein, partial [Acidobacteriota bacterium]
SPPGIPAILQLRGLFPTIILPASGQGVPLNLNLPRPYNNMGVPGFRMHDLVATTTDNGGIADLILRRQGFTQLEQGLGLHPTFVTLWIGNNDVLAAATSGRVIEGVTLTPVAQFQAELTAAVGAITHSGAKLAIANIPNVTSIPFVTTLPIYIFNPQTNQPVLVNGHPIPFIGPNGPLQPGDYVLLTASTELAQGKGIPVALGGSGQPLSDSVVLSAAEVATIQDRVNAYNTVIAGLANQVGAALVDDNAVLNQLRSGFIPMGGIEFTSAFLTGGVFGYDGVHPTKFGYGYIANLFITAINQKFGTKVPLVDLSKVMFGGSTTSALRSAHADQTGGAPFVFTEAAAANLRKALNVPSDAQINQILRRRGHHGHH